MIGIICIVLTTTYLLVSFGKIAVRNHQAHQFFKKNSTLLPTLPNPNLFSGHIFDVLHKDKNCQIISNLHEKYGPTFGYYSADKPIVSTKDINLIKLIQVDEAHKHVNRGEINWPFQFMNDSIWQVRDDDWRRARKVFASAMTNIKVQSSEISAHIRSTVEELNWALDEKLMEAKQQADCRTIELEANDIFLRFSLAVIFRITYKRDDLIDFKAEHDYWSGMMDSGSKKFTNLIFPLNKMFRFLEPLFQYLIKYDQTGYVENKLVKFLRDVLENNRVNCKNVNSFIEEKSEGEHNQNGRRDTSRQREMINSNRRLVDDIVDAFMNKEISYKDFMASTNFLLIAGFQTTAESITHLVWQLSLNPEIQDKLRKSIAANGIESEYLTWCIKEGLRLHPPGPLGSGRILGDDVVCNGLLIPKGTHVMPSVYSIHRDSEMWPEPEQFKPERWENSKEFHPAAFMAFGLGPRNCVGGKLAMFEIKLVIQMLLINYRIVKFDATPNQYNFSSPGLIFTVVDQPVMVGLESLN